MKQGICIFVGLLVFVSTALHAQTLQQVLDAPSLTWTTTSGSGPTGWAGQTTTSHDGVSAAKTATVNNATLQTIVTGPGTLTFWWMGSDPSPDGENSKLIAYIGTTPLLTNSGDFAWSQQTLYVGAGSQTLKWIFSAPGTTTAHPGYMDQVVWTTGTTAPFLTFQPLSQSVVPGLNATFNVGASGTPPLKYQWQLNGTNISNATNATFTVTNAQAASLGNYHAIVSNSTGTNTSADASLEFGQLVVWGETSVNDNRGAAPPGATNVVQISGGWEHHLLVRADGSVLNWGTSNVVQSPGGNISNVLSVAAFHGAGVALNPDGTVSAWGTSSITNVPANLTNVIAISQGPSALYCLALKADGKVVGWGDNFYNQTNIPASVSNVVSIAAGEQHGMALKSDGTIVAWGDNTYGQRTIPTAQLYSTTNRVVAIAAGAWHSLALRSDGTVFAWGNNGAGQTNVPVASKGAIAIAAGFAHNLALRTNGTVVVWGRNEVGQTNMPANLSNVVAIAAGAFHSIAQVSDGTPAATAPSANPNFSAGAFSFSIPSQSGRVFELDYKNSLTDTNWTVNWTAAPLFAGNGTNLFLTDTNATNFQRFYRVRRW